MSKAKDYIRDYTKRCSNKVADTGFYNPESGKEEFVYCPWLTPENDLAAVEIERQEVIEEAYKWLEENSQKYVYWMDEEFGKEDLIEDFKKYFKNE